MERLQVGVGVGVLVLLLSAIPLVSQGADENWQVGVSATYYSGNYGTSSRTNTTYVPVSIRRLLRDGDLTLVIPYIRIVSDGTVTVVNGIPTRTGRIRFRQRPVTTRTTNDGLGDILLQGRYYILDERDFLPTVALTARAKAPTASADNGLGTGEWDEGVGAELSKKLADNWMGFGDLGYTIIGKPTNVILRNQWNYDVGLGYNFTKVLLGSVYYEEWRALVPGTVNLRDFLFAVNYKATPTVRFNVALEKGVSSGAPEYGITGGLSLRF